MSDGDASRLVVDLAHRKVQHEEGLITFLSIRASSVWRTLAQLPPDQQRKARRKWRKTWRKACRKIIAEAFVRYKAGFDPWTTGPTYYTTWFTRNGGPTKEHERFSSLMTMVEDVVESTQVGRRPGSDGRLARKKKVCQILRRHVNAVVREMMRSLPAPVP